MGLSWEFGERERGESEVGDCSRSGDTSGGLGIDSGLAGDIGLGGREGLWIISMSTNINSVIFVQSGIYLSIDAQVTGGVWRRAR